VQVTPSAVLEVSAATPVPARLDKGPTDGGAGADSDPGCAAYSLVAPPLAPPPIPLPPSALPTPAPLHQQQQTQPDVRRRRVLTCVAEEPIGSEDLARVSAFAPRIVAPEATFMVLVMVYLKVSMPVAFASSPHSFCTPLPHASFCTLSHRPQTAPRHAQAHEDEVRAMAMSGGYTDRGTAFELLRTRRGQLVTVTLHLPAGDDTLELVAAPDAKQTRVVGMQRGRKLCYLANRDTVVHRLGMAAGSPVLTGRLSAADENSELAASAACAQVGGVRRVGVVVGAPTPPLSHNAGAFYVEWRRSPSKLSLTS
jgi:hypothetical protein